jgi:hypothetical protein
MSRAGCSRSALGGAACTLIALVAAGLPVRAHAGTTAVGAPAVEEIAGWEGDSHGQGYGFAGFGWLVPAGARLVVPLRAFGSYLYYNFESSGTITKVRSPGLTLLAGIRFPGAGGSFTLLAGGEARREYRTSDAGAGTAETKTTSGIVLQADGDRAFGRRWRGYVFANYGGATRYLYGRTAMRYQVTNLDWKGPASFFLGLEAVGQGNDESEAAQGGGFAEWNLVPRRLSLALHGGYKENWSPGESHHRGGYLGLTLYHRF